MSKQSLNLRLGRSQKLKKRQVKVQLKIYENGREVVRLDHTYKYDKFLAALEAYKPTLGVKSEYYLKVTYGRGEDCFGEKIDFYNDGTYTSKKETAAALAAMTEPDLINYIQR